MKNISLVLLIFVSTLGCRSSIKPDHDFRLTNTDAKQSFATWLDGGDVLIRDTSSPEELFIQGEASYFEGNSSTAFKKFMQLLLTSPDHPLARLSASRLYEIRKEVPDFSYRFLKNSKKMEFKKLSPSAKASYLVVYQAAKYEAWKYGDSSKPFDASSVGFPQRWTVTPQMSPWRLRDFDRVFIQEKEEGLRPKYVSPVDAVEDERNENIIRPYWTDGVSISPGLSRSGIYYFESFAEVENADKFWLFGNFAAAAKVWINGKLVMERREGTYDSSERFREIELSKGIHRILVKFAFQSDYRDWFDLGFVSKNGLDVPIQFNARCLNDRKLPGCIPAPKISGTIDFSSEVYESKDIEPLYAKINEMEDASDFMLYVTMLASLHVSDTLSFTKAWGLLRERNPKFAAGHWLEHEYIEGQWDIPSEMRSSESLKAIKRAYDLDHNARFSLAVVNEVTKNKTDEERKLIIKPMFDMAVKNGVENFKLAYAWPGFLAERGWDSEQESALGSLLKNKWAVCGAAQSILDLKENRNIYLKKSDFPEWINRCPGFKTKMINRYDVGSNEKITYYQKQVARFPLSNSLKKSLARQLQVAGKPYAGLLKEAEKQAPYNDGFWAKEIDKLVGEGKEKEALDVLDTFEKQEGVKGWTLWKRSLLRDKIPLGDLLRDGKLAAMEAVKKGNKASLSKDDRYFVIDFAARRYFPNGSHLTLTHTVTRLMTKKAIDDFAEQNLPSNAQILRVQTIKENGEIRTPEVTAGKSTLSMPGLAEGDFVEIAYLQFSSAPALGTAIDGIRFFFQMEGISTLHSEYVIIGDEGSFLLKNNPPQAEPFDYHGLKAIRFLAKNNPAPRPEPASPSSSEYLPWVQMYRNPFKITDFEVARRTHFELIQDALKKSNTLKKKFAGLLSEESRGEDFIRKAFYQVARAIKTPSPRDLSTEVSHALLLEKGNPILVLKALFNEAGLESDIYLARSVLAVKEIQPYREISNYGTMLLRVKNGGDYIWLYPVGEDAMYGAIDSYSLGQKAVCLSCKDPQWTEIPESVPHMKGTKLSVEGKVDASGTLIAKIMIEIDGLDAVRLRTMLRSRPDDSARERWMEGLGTTNIPGSAMTKYEIINEKRPDLPIKLGVWVKRPKYAVKVKGNWLIETHIFPMPLESQYASLPSRNLPLFLRYSIQNKSKYRVEFPFSKIEILSQEGDFDFKSEFGNISRSVNLEGNTIHIDTLVDLSVQRISTASYPAFQKWAGKVEQSSALVIRGK